MRIAIFGATGYIGRSLLALCVERGLDVVPYTRDTGKAKGVFTNYGIKLNNTPHTYNNLSGESYDIIINASGKGSPSANRMNPRAVFEVTETMDNLIFEYLRVSGNESTCVFNLSSGAVHGKVFNGDNEALANFNLDKLGADVSDYYGLVKLSSEKRHRDHIKYKIIDLRVFAFFSKYLDIEEDFFLSQVVIALVEDKELSTNGKSMIRDCITTRDLLDSILFLYKNESKNDAFDLVTLGPFEKFHFLDECTRRFKLRWSIDEEGVKSPTGGKDIYTSMSAKLQQHGFTPSFSSENGIFHEMNEFFKKR